MSHYITSHDDKGTSVFSKSLTERIVHRVPGGTIEIVASAHTVPANVSTNEDIEKYEHDRVHLFPRKSPLCPPVGTATAIVSLEPNASSTMHRTLTLDSLVILEGTVELHLDSAQSIPLKAGDTVTQRATMHLWKNITPNNGWAKMACFTVPVVQPLTIDGKSLEMDMGSDQ
ncbi:hypothetical protein K431DRAFT_286377 [Polychaeton citri CBS 116435]|uniref:Uncharacterized protein n=1 Tax=Polychaeton citri CBS 116435 TaxID=1314669 RepID=A0A9P4Q582_9PEZI|nr:hypothetical protein K431DRAFT_286377 [Polychaeton citri CBS 116435]